MEAEAEVYNVEAAFLRAPQQVAGLQVTMNKTRLVQFVKAPGGNSVTTIHASGVLFCCKSINTQIIFGLA